MKLVVAILLLFPFALAAQDKVKLRTGQEYEVTVTNITAEKLYYVNSPSDSAINQKPIRIDALKSVYIDNLVKYQSLLSKNSKLKLLVSEEPKNSYKEDPYLKRIEPHTQQQFENLEGATDNTDMEVSATVLNPKPISEKYGVFVIPFRQILLPTRIIVDTGTFKDSFLDSRRLWKGPDNNPINFLSVAHALNFLNSKGWELIQVLPVPSEPKYNCYLMRKRVRN